MVAPIALVFLRWSRRTKTGNENVILLIYFGIMTETQIGIKFSHFYFTFTFSFRILNKFPQISTIRLDCEQSLFSSKIRGKERKTVISV